MFYLFEYIFMSFNIQIVACIANKLGQLINCPNYNFMLRNIYRYSFTASNGVYSPIKLFQQRKILYQYTSELLTEANFYQKQQSKIGKDKILSVYCGYDPTADSLHLGNLVSIIMMARLHKLVKLRPIFLMGGATGLIGDPSGKKNQRELLAQQRVQSNLQSINTQIKSIYGKIIDDMIKNQQQYGLSIPKTQKSSQPLFVNNHDFYKNMNVLTFLRDVGKLFRVNSMLAKEIVSTRLQSESGISYTEFSYSILQSYDFYKLHRQYGCVLQFGGSDQWGNITNGCDLIRRQTKRQLQGFGITMPLLLTKTGEKFGKSQGNALFLNGSKTPISNIYDYFYNTPDEDIEKLLYIFTLYSPSRIQTIMKQQKTRPQLRTGQKILAQKVTNWLGSYKNMKQQLMKMSAEDLKNKTSQQLKSIYQGLSNQMKQSINQAQLLSTNKFLPDIFVKFGLCKSKNEARKDIEGQGAYINNVKIPKNSSQTPLSQIISKNKLSGNYVLLRKGKKKYFLLKIQN